MQNRWFILAVLFVVRIAMGFQFQSIASVSTFLIEDLHIDYTRFGLLIGIFMLPGIVLAYIGGVLGKRYGGKQVVMAALFVMALGGFLIGISSSFVLAVAGRVLSGIGAVFLSVLLTKMATDWFAGKEIVTAMGVLMSSWPLGISLSLMILGPLAIEYSWSLAMHTTAVLCLFGIGILGAFYREPSDTVTGKGPGPSGNGLSRQETILAAAAGTIWMLFNVGFIVIPSFAPSFFTSIGYSITEAGFLISTATWIVIPAIPLGGYLAERFKRPNTFLVICLLGIGVAMCLMPFGRYPVILLIWISLLFGPPVRIIISLPTEVLRPENSVPGMGI